MTSASWEVETPRGVFCDVLPDSTGVPGPKLSSSTSGGLYLSTSERRTSEPVAIADSDPVA